MAEWTVGIKGSPSIQELDQKYGTHWRPDHKETQWHSQRMIIVRELRRRAEAMAGGYAANITAVVEQMEVERKRAGHLSLNQVTKRLKQEENARANTPKTQGREEEEKEE